MEGKSVATFLANALTGRGSAVICFSVLHTARKTLVIWFLHFSDCNFYTTFVYTMHDSCLVVS